MSFHHHLTQSSFLQLSLAIFPEFSCKRFFDVLIFITHFIANQATLVFKIMVFCGSEMYFVLMEIQLPKPIYIFAVVLNINETSFTHKLELFDSLVLFLSRFFQEVGNSMCWKAVLQYLFHWNWWFINTVCNFCFACTATEFSMNCK